VARSPGSARAAWLAVLLLGLAPRAGSQPTTVGGTVLEIPTPTGFQPASGDLASLADFSQPFVPASNREIASFVQDEDARAIRDGREPRFERRHSAQVLRALEDTLVTHADFAQLKAEMRESSAELAGSVEKELSSAVEKVADGVTVDMEAPGAGVSVLPPHFETDRVLSVSQRISTWLVRADGTRTALRGTVTLSYVHVRGRLVFLYAFGQEDALDWTREASRQWALAVVAANPSDAATASREARRGTGRGIDWSRVGQKAVVGAVVGALVGLVLALVRRGTS